MNARQPRAAYRRLARMAEYTAKIARALADPDTMRITEQENPIRTLRKCVGRQQEQFETIARYLAQGDMMGLGALPVRRRVQRNPSPRNLNIRATRDAISDHFMETCTGEDPDWVGGALCDLGMCESAEEIRAWAEENCIEGVDGLFVYSGEGANAI